MLLRARGRLALLALVPSLVALDPGSALGHPAPRAGADRVLVDYADAPPPGVRALALTCPGAAASSAVVTTTTAHGPSGVPYGDDALDLGTAASDEPALALDVGSLADLQTLAVAAAEPTSPPVSPTVRARVSVHTGDGSWLLQTLQKPDQTPWVVRDLGSAGYTWQDLDQPGSPTTVGTLTDFVAAHGDGPATATMAFSSCGQVAVDGLRWGPTGDATTYDLESPHDTRVLTTVQGTPATGSEVGCRLYSALPTDGPAPLADRPVDVLARPVGTPGSSVVATGTTDADGDVLLAVHPLTTTDYRCRFAGDGPRGNQPEFAPAVSPPARLGVPSTLTLHLVRHGRRVTARGSTSPAQPGTPVHLLARAPHRPGVRVDGTVAGDGGYVLTARLGPGRWRLRVTEAATATTTTGRSTARWVRVR